uniref:LAM_G_DOMAIN domain-containing protein n=1 Tax=Panagrellus redivivus TaxID=6233 RepID=A0A7E4V9U4_PANRE
MMHFVDVAFFWLAAIGQSVAKVELRKGVNQTVTFEGEEVEIHVNKEIDRAGFLIICFGSAPDTSFDFCPKGYATFSTTSEATTRHHILKVNRQGRLTQDSSDRGVAGTIEFNEDGALNILVKKLPDDGTTVILPNAEKWVPKPTVKVDETKKKPKSNVTVYVVIACCFLLLLIITGIMIYFYINRRKKDPMPLGSPQEGSNSDKSMENTRVLTSPVVVKSPMPIHASPQSPAKPISKPIVLSPIHTKKVRAQKGCAFKRLREA